jgi:hypothetical protein
MRFRAMERGANAAIAGELAALEAELVSAPARRGAKKKRAAQAKR